jgi:1,4-dihydroxy-2-naphthoate octaprenyltransferase
VFLRLLKKTTNDISLDFVSFLRNLLDPFLACLLMAVALVSAKQYFLSSSPDLASLSFLLIIGAGFYTGWFCLFSRQTFGEIASICHTLGFGKLTSFFKRKSVDALGKS